VVNVDSGSPWRAERSNLFDGVIKVMTLAPAMVWGGIFLREDRLRALIPLQA